MLLLGLVIFIEATVYFKNQKSYIDCYETVLRCKWSWSLRSTMLNLKIFSFGKPIINLQTCCSTIINFKFRKSDFNLFSKRCLYPEKILLNTVCLTGMIYRSENVFIWYLPPGAIHKLWVNVWKWRRNNIFFNFFSANNRYMTA